jgi:hypothetical protein
MNKPIRGKKHTVDIINKILKKTGIKLFGKYINNKTKTRFMCICGNIFCIKPVHILSGHTKSCGCLWHRTGKNGTRWLGYEEISKNFFNTVERNAKARDLKFDIDIKYMWKLFIKQKRKCALSGVPIRFANSNKDRTKYCSASLDRINSKKGYVKNNVQWVHKDINKMKRTMKDDDFLQWCKIITKYNKGKI